MGIFYPGSISFAEISRIFELAVTHCSGRGLILCAQLGFYFNPGIEKA